jgi:hypothetical protein
MQSIDWKCDVQVNFAEQNLGCKMRMASGIDWVFSQVEEAIFLEDDCVPCPDFFEFCSELLEYYRDKPQVVHIAGTNYQEGRVRGDGSYFFSRYPHIWGWASWRRAWQYYDADMRSWPQAKEEKWIAKAFSTPLERQYWSEGIERVYTGNIDTWDFQWAYACWRQEGIAVIPNVNLITNIGVGPDATHTKEASSSLNMPTKKLGPLRHPKEISVDHAADRFTFDHHYGGAHLASRETSHEKVSRPFPRFRQLARRVLNVLLGMMGIPRQRAPRPPGSIDKPETNTAIARTL